MAMFGRLTDEAETILYPAAVGAAYEMAQEHILHAPTPGAPSRNQWLLDAATWALGRYGERYVGRQVGDALENVGGAFLGADTLNWARTKFKPAAAMVRANAAVVSAAGQARAMPLAVGFNGYTGGIAQAALY